MTLTEAGNRSKPIHSLISSPSLCNPIWVPIGVKNVRYLFNFILLREKRKSCLFFVSCLSLCKILPAVDGILVSWRLCCCYFMTLLSAAMIYFCISVVSGAGSGLTAQLAVLVSATYF